MTDKCCGQPNYLKDLVKISATGSAGRAPDPTPDDGSNDQLREDSSVQLREDSTNQLRES